MKHIKIFEDFETKNNILIVVDVQKSFRKFFTEMYLHEVKKYCKSFKTVYQIWDNHTEKTPDKDYLYDKNPDIPIEKDLYQFPNQVDLIEKRYNYDVDADFYKKILDKETYLKIKGMEDANTLKSGNFFATKEGTIFVYIGNNHKWHHLSKKLYDILQKLKGKDVIIIGGSKSECLLDIEVCGLAMGVKIKRNEKYIYSASHCPIK